MGQFRKLNALVCAALLLLAAMCLPALAESNTIFAGGTGTTENPWQIATAEQFAAFADSVNDGSRGGYAGCTVVLTEDIDLAGMSWTPIGNMEDMEGYTTMFLGVFDGQGHTVSNMTYETDEFAIGVGLFGINVGEIRNVRMTDAVVACMDGTSQAIAALVGYNMGAVSGCEVSGAQVTGNACVGGVIGGNMGPVSDCTVSNTTIIVIGDNDFSDGLVQCDIAECAGLVIGGGFGGTVDGCAASGTILAEGNEPVGLGGIGGCLEMMDFITNCTADVTIVSAKGGHAIGGLCGYAGTHSNGQIVAETEGIVTTQYPCVVENCAVSVRIEAPEATHVGGLVGTGLYYYGEETAFAVRNCSVSGEIVGAAAPGAIAGRAENSIIENCTFEVMLNGEALTAEVGTTDCMYESADQ